MQKKRPLDWIGTTAQFTRMTVQFVGNDRMIITNRPLVSVKTGGRF